MMRLRHNVLLLLASTSLSAAAAAAEGVAAAAAGRPGPLPGASAPGALEFPAKPRGLASPTPSQRVTKAADKADNKGANKAVDRRVAPTSGDGAKLGLCDGS